MEIPDQIKNKHILLVDDDDSMIMTTKGILSGIGFTNLYEASDGLEALNIMENEFIDYVVCDWNMPKLSGLDLFKKAQNDIELKGIPFLMLTASSDINSVKKAIAAGINDYMIKPFQPDAFLKKVITKLQEHS